MRRCAIFWVTIGCKWGRVARAGCSLEYEKSSESFGMAESASLTLVVLELSLPKLDGWKAFQQIKKDDPQIKVIVATGHPNSDIRSAMERGELRDLFIKPYEVDAVLKRVSELTRPRSSNRAN